MQVVRVLIYGRKCIVGKVTRTSERFFSIYAGNSKDILKLEEAIKKHTCIARNSLTPEIALHLITPSCPLWSSPLDDIPFTDPFWAFYWPGGQALARYILDNPDCVSGQKVLDIGSGCGAGAIAAALSNARQVVANDIDAVAGCAISLNCSLNNVEVTECKENLIGKSKNMGNCILVGDMFYDDEFSKVLIEWLLRLRKEGNHIFIGDPGRMSFIKYEDHFQCLATYILGEENFSPGYTQVSTWKMK